METPNKKYTEMCYKTREQGAGQLVYEDLSRKIKKTSKEHVGFEIDGAIPVWESLRKNRVTLRYDVRSILNFANYTRRKEKRAEGVIKFKHKYTTTQQLIFWKVLIKLLAAKLVENKAMITIPKIGKLMLSKTNRKATYFDTTENKYKKHLNLHTLRKFVGIKFDKEYDLDAASVRHKKNQFIKFNIYLHYSKGVEIYKKTLEEIKTKYGLH